VLENVYVIWFVKFTDGLGDHKDCCGYKRTREKELFKITSDSLETIIVAAKGGQVSRVVELELEVPVEVKNKYHYRNEGKYHYRIEGKWSFAAGFRKPSREDSFNSTVSTIDAPAKRCWTNKEASGYLKDFDRERKKKQEIEQTSNNFFPELQNTGWENIVLDDTCWEEIDEDERKALLERNIMQLWVPKKQAEMLFKKSPEIPLPLIEQELSDEAGLQAHQERFTDAPRRILEEYLSGSVGISKRQAYMAWRDLLERRLQQIPFDRTDIRLKIIAEKNAITAWLDGTGKAPTTFDSAILVEFPSMYLAQYRTDDATSDVSTNATDIKGTDVIGQVKLEAYFFPITWNTIKKWLREKGINDPPKGEVWKAPASVCLDVIVENKDFIERKRKNIK
jgi:hypothetical protein